MRQSEIEALFLSVSLVARIPVVIWELNKIHFACVRGKHKPIYSCRIEI